MIIETEKNREIDETARQKEFIELARTLTDQKSNLLGRPLTYCLTTFGCQMNEKQSEAVAGIMDEIGYHRQDNEEADVVIYNTCTVRENANLKVYGRLGKLHSLKKSNPDMKIALFGCMMQEKQVVDKIQKDYPFVNLVFGTHNIFKFAELFYEMENRDSQLIDIWEGTDKIVEELADSGINVDHISRTDEANTSLAFVALMENGDREFSFYRKPGADMLYQPEQVPENVFRDAYALHFCSVSLGDFPMKEAHKKAVEYASKAGAVISFDPNLRPQLWEDEEKLCTAVKEFLPYSDILKLSDEELFFITGKEQIQDALEDLFDLGISVVLYTKGSHGAEVYTRKASASVPGRDKKAVDTTGAGDGFIGSFLNQLAFDGKSLEDMRQMTSEQWEQYLTFSNVFCGESIQKKGAISSYITREQMQILLP